MTTTTAPTTQTYHVFIRATPRQVWDAITQPEHSAQYLFGALVETTGETGTAERVAGIGWMRVLSGLKTVLETGTGLNT